MCLAGVTFLRIICFSLTSSSGHTFINIQVTSPLTILHQLKAVNEWKLQLMLLITSSQLQNKVLFNMAIKFNLSSGHVLDVLIKMILKKKKLNFSSILIGSHSNLLLSFNQINSHHIQYKILFELCLTSINYWINHR